jgi:hypothetical protein
MLSSMLLGQRSTRACDRLLGNTLSVPSLAVWRGTKGRYPRCQVVEKTKNDPIGGSQWDTLGGNSENSIRPLMCRPACTLYSQGSVVGRGRMHQDDQGRIGATAID